MVIERDQYWRLPKIARSSPVSLVVLRTLRVMTLSSSGGALGAVMPGNRLSKPGSVWRSLHDRAAPSVTTPSAPGGGNSIVS